MSDAVLIYPQTGFEIRGESVGPPLSLLTIASTVAHDFRIKIIDQRTDPNWRQTLRAELRERPLCVGISSMTGAQIRYGLEAAHIAKETGATVVWGGIHATLLPEQTAGDPLIDAVVLGEGELIFRELLQALADKRDLKTVGGILYKDHGQIRRNPPGQPVDIAALPELPYHLVDIERYVDRSLKRTGIARALPFITSRGCPFQCTFCCNPRLSLRRWRALPAEEAYAQVSRLVERYHLDGIVFNDENFFGNPRRAERLGELIGGKFRWYVQGRMDAFLRVDLNRLYENGLRVVQPGIESGSPRILGLIRKDETKETMIAANRALAATGIVPIYNFIIGFPTETEEEMAESVDFALQLLADNPRAEIAGFYIFVPYPGTELYDVALAHGFKFPASLGEWAKYSRQHLDTPWIQDRVPALKYISLTSKLVDGKRLKNLLQNTPIPEMAYNLVGGHFRRKWRAHKFNSRLETLLLERAASLFVKDMV